jgi:cytochrome b561
MESLWKWLSLLVTLGWMGFILSLPSQSQPPMPPAPAGFPLAVVAHFCLYAALAVLMVRTFTLHWPARNGLRVVVLPTIALCLAGVALMSSIRDLSQGGTHHWRTC